MEIDLNFYFNGDNSRTHKTIRRPLKQVKRYSIIDYSTIKNAVLKE